MNKKKLLKFSLINFIVGIFVFIINYFFFHFVTDEGISLIWHEEAGKPFVANMIGMFGVLFIWSSAISLIAALVFFKDKD